METIFLSLFINLWIDDHMRGLQEFFTGLISLQHFYVQLRIFSYGPAALQPQNL